MPKLLKRGDIERDDPHHPTVALYFTVCEKSSLLLRLPAIRWLENFDDMLSHFDTILVCMYRYIHQHNHAMHSIAQQKPAFH